MRVLVIGGAGYIGSHVVKAMMDAGHQVTVFDNLSTGQLCNIFSGTEFIAGDTRHSDDIDAAFARGFDGAVYLAAFKAVGESMVQPEKYSINNISATMNILNAAVKHGCLRFVFSSSAAVYGSPAYLPIDEKHPKNPESYYGFTKLKTEEFLQWYDQLKGLKFASLRYFNAAGYDPSGSIAGLERNPQNLLPIIMEVAAGMRKELQIFGNDYPTRDGTCIRDYVHVSDLAKAHTDALRYIDEKNESLIVNLGSETGITVSEMLEAARSITGKEIPARFVDRRPGDPAELYATAQHARETIGWNPRYSDVKTLIESTWNMYKNR
ncbi:MAG: UDP-glucose 4-epimerase GalE [Treponema sp.]|uniref:UDP-glucose 4-epimerase GalE n=1 Tax=Treponema sp. TaxID=166 RepID=UPI003FA257F2